MEERTSYARLTATDQQRPRAKTTRFVWIMVAVAAVVLGAAGGYRYGRDGHGLPGWLPATVANILGMKATPGEPPSGPIIYYRHPDGKPLYSAEPRSTDDGRPFIAVLASEDLSFDEGPAQAPSERRILYYRNPMGLPDTSPVPKKDSMGMDYIPVYEGEADDATITIAPGKLQRTGVRSETVERRILSRPVRVPGAMKLDERRVSVISMRSDSFIERVENVTTGDRVRKGQPLLELYSPEVNAAAAQLIANPGFDGSRRRLENLAVPAEVINEIERTRKVPRTITWSAPRDGIILERNAIEGMRAPSGQALFRVADTTTIWVLADVPEHELGLIKPGQTVTIRVRSLPNQNVTGRVALIYPQVNVDTRTARVRIEIPNKEGLLLPDMYADVEVRTGSGSPVIAVPDSALIDTGTRQIVILDKGDGRFEPREVKVGTRGEGFIEVREGVSEGNRVVVAANFLIDAESNLKAALRAMTAPEAPQ